MPQERSFEEKQAIFLDVLDRMKQYTMPSIAQICGNIDDMTGELIGSGTFVSLRGSFYLVTAQHVAGESFTENIDGTRKYASGLSHSTGNNQRMANIVAPWITWGPPQDIAVTRIDPVVLRGTEVVPLGADHFALNTENLDHDIYFIHGWPGQQSRFTTFFGRGVMSRSLPYGGWLESSLWPGFDDRVHFAITYPPNELIDEGRNAATLPNPGGLSGAFVWKTNKAGTGEEWSPEMAKIVGLAHRFDQDARCVVVTRVEHTKGLLLHVLQAEHAYFRWLGRGKPMWDDLADWFDAVRIVKNLRG